MAATCASRNNSEPISILRCGAKGLRVHSDHERLCTRRAYRAHSGVASDPGFHYHCDACVDLNNENVEDVIMAWTTPTLVEICIGLEINGYLPAEF